MATFVKWLSAQDTRQDEVGELARRWDADDGHGNVSSPSGVGKRLASWPDAEQAGRWLASATVEYNQGRATAAAAAQPGEPETDATARTLAAIRADVAWLRLALTAILPAETVAALSVAETLEFPDIPDTPIDFAALWSAADFTPEPTAVEQAALADPAVVAAIRAAQAGGQSELRARPRDSGAAIAGYAEGVKRAAAGYTEQPEPDGWQDGFLPFPGQEGPGEGPQSGHIAG